VVRESFSDVATEVPYARQTKAGKYTSPDGRREIEFVATAYFEFGVDLKPGLPDNAERDMITDEADGAVFYVAALVDQTGLEEFLVAYLTTE
jgi:hypothetical protein